MKLVTGLSALFGVVAGLLFGLLLWGGAPAPALPAAAGGKLEAEMLAALRDIRTLLERQPSGVRPGVSADATLSVPAEPQPLTAGASARSVEDFRVALDEAVAALHRAATEGGGFAGQAVSPDAAETLKAAFEPKGKRGPLKVFGCSPREVYALLGPPGWARAENGEIIWGWNPDPQNPNRELNVRFADGYAISSWAREQ